MMDSVSKQEFLMIELVVTRETKGWSFAPGAHKAGILQEKKCLRQLLNNDMPHKCAIPNSVATLLVEMYLKEIPGA